MNILHIDLEKIGDQLSYHYFWNSPEQLKTYQISPQRITIDPDDPKATGLSLYQWLNGPDGILDQQLKAFRESNSMIAIYGNSELPWELLHDGDDFLVNRSGGALLPVRCYKSDTSKIGRAHV